MFCVKSLPASLFQREGNIFQKSNPRAQAKVPSYRQALNLAWYRAGRCGYSCVLTLFLTNVSRFTTYAYPDYVPPR